MAGTTDQLAADPASGPEIFRLRACPGCDYSLAALRPEGICPECGRPYDQRYIILTGKGRGRFSSMAGGNWRGDVGTVLWAVFLLWMFTSGSSSLKDPSFIFWGVVAVVATVLSLYARLFSARPPAAQVWIAPEGIVQVASTPEARRMNRIGRDCTWLLLPLGCIAIPILYSDHPLGWIRLSVLILAIVGSAIWWWFLRRRYQADDGMDFVPRFCPWALVLSVEMTILAHERYRLRCKGMNYWKRIHIINLSVVDIEIECKDADAGHLNRYIQIQINQALSKGKKSWQSSH